MMQIKKIDILFFCYVFITTFLLFFSWDNSGKSLELFLIRGLLLGIGLTLIYLDSKVKNSFLNLLRNCYPVLFSMLFYTETVFYNKMCFNNLDSYLVDLDFQLFGFQPSIQFSKYFSNPLFSELMYIGYFSLYILIIGFVFITFFKLKKDREEFFFKLAASMLLFYLFFCFFPAAGPQFYFQSPEKNLPTAYIFDGIMHFIQKAEQPTGAFPSSHVGISLIILILFRKRVANYFKIAIPFVVLLILSTVYIKAHYAIDAIAGVALYPVHGEELDSLAPHATIALENSNTSSQKISTYSPELNYYSTRRLSLMGDLLKAIESNNLSLFLQPQVDLADGSVIGAEALIRWEHEQHGFVRPDEFIPLAEQSGLIRPLTAWVIDRVLQYDKKFQSLGYDIQLSINISAKNIVEVNIVKNTLDKLIEYGTSPKRLVFEMTETAMMDNPEKALNVLNDLSDLGIKLSIDDFGTGYSSLSYLNQLPVDELKIDRSFVTDMIKSPQNQKIVEMTVNLAHTLGLKVVAEGIEDQETMLQLQALGCDVAQGYHIGRPMPEEAFLNWLEKQSGTKVRSITRAVK